MIVVGIGCASNPDDITSPEPRETVAPEPSSLRSTGAQTPVLVDVAERIPDAVLDIRYATANNFTGEVLYPRARCLLRPEVAEGLARAADFLRARGFRLRLWDCYRPFHVQEKLYEIVSDPRYVGQPERDPQGVPRKGSRHNRGAAVDLTLITASGADVAMPTGYDDFSAAAHRSNLQRDGAMFEHARLLEQAMTRAGFVGLPTEWWHYDARDWKRYPLLDIGL